MGHGRESFVALHDKPTVGHHSNSHSFPPPLQRPALTRKTRRVIRTEGVTSKTACSKPINDVQQVVRAYRFVSEHPDNHQHFANHTAHANARYLRCGFLASISDLPRMFRRWLTQESIEFLTFWFIHQSGRSASRSPIILPPRQPGPCFSKSGTVRSRYSY
jgi:hypothetical protein